jgi:signal transduction histidine kinase/DNA-binding NarL/FixJ family response regulator
LIDRLLLPAIVGLTTVIAALILWQRLIAEQRGEIQAATQAQALLVKDKLDEELRARILSFDRLAGLWKDFAPANDATMESERTLLVNGYRAYQAIGWIDPTFHVSWIEPQSEADFSSGVADDVHQRVALKKAEDSGRVVITSVNLRSGGHGLFVCAPAFHEQEFQGFLFAVIDDQELLSSIFGGGEQNYWVAVYDAEKELYRSSGSDHNRMTAWAEEASFQFRQLPLRVRVWPKPQTLASARSPLPTVTFLAGSLMAALLAFAVFIGQTAEHHAREVATINRNLQDEISGREQAEEALRSVQKMEAIGRLAGGVAHDFNNLLMVIRGHAALSLDYFGTDHPMHRELNEILKATERASSLTRQLLAFSRKQVLQHKVLDLNSIVNQAAQLLTPALGESIHVSLDLESGLGLVKADAAQLEQVIMNLAFNARDAMPDGGTLTIQTANIDVDESWKQRYPHLRVGPHVVLSVQDTGCGMDSETQSRIFEPFFTTKERTKGTGLGLATVYGTIDQSGGCIAVSSQLGEGTTVKVYLPRTKETLEVAAKPGPVSESTLAHERILVVEDDGAVRRMTCEFLKIKGYGVVEVSSAPDAIRFMETHGDSIDLVLTDVSMPKMKGTELVERLANLRPGLKVLYMSAYTEDAAINSGILGPGNAFIEKPFSPDELASKVRQVLVVSGTRIIEAEPDRGAPPIEIQAESVAKASSARPG